MIENSELSRFRVAPVLSVEVVSDRLKLRLFKGSCAAELLGRFTEVTGRQPFPSAAWFLGPWIQTGHANLVPLEDEQKIIATVRDADAPISAVETHMRRLPGGAHEGQRDAERHAPNLSISTGWPASPTSILS